MARALACASSFVLVTALAVPALAEEKDAPRVGSVVLPGTAGTLLVAITTILHRPPAAQTARMPAWTGPPPGLPRATVATVWKVTF